MDMELDRLHISTFVIHVNSFLFRSRLNLLIKNDMKLQILHILTPVIYVSRHFHSELD